MWPNFKTKMFIYQSKSNLDEKILLPKIRQMPGRELHGYENSMFHSGP